MTCVNCGRKGHAASEGRQPKRERAERLCFNCGKPGHVAKACKQPKSVHAVEPGGLPAAGKPPAVFAVTVAPPRRQQANLGDFIVKKFQNKVNHNRYHTMSMDNGYFWTEIAAKVASDTALRAADRPCATTRWWRRRFLQQRFSKSFRQVLARTFVCFPQHISSSIGATSLC